MTLPAYIPGDHNTGADREKQAGAHHDGMHFFPLARGKRGSEHGVLCRELTRTSIRRSSIRTASRAGATAAARSRMKCARKLASHGVGVVELAKHRRRRMESHSQQAQPPHHGADADGADRSGARLGFAEDEVQPERHEDARHAQQLRERLHAVGDVPHLRGELGRLFFQYGDGRTPA